MVHKTKTRITFLLFSVIWGGVLFASIITGIGTNPLSMDKDNSLLVSSIIPQGWGFFSKDPRDTQLGLYKADSESSDILWPNMNFENFFGVHREGRAQGVEAGMIFTEIEDKQWTNCKKGLDECEKLVDKKPIGISNDAPEPLLCGEYVMTREDPIPWSYAKYSSEKSQITKIAKVDIKCSKR